MSYSDSMTEYLGAARAGSLDALGQALEACRTYLLLVANEAIEPRLNAKGGASDMVQLTFLEAQRDFSQFAGTTEIELRAWLKRLLLHNVADFVRNFRGTDKRQLDRERPLTGNTAVLSVDSTRLPTPSRQLVAREEAEQVQLAILQLPADYQEVIRLRHQEDLPFDEIANRLHRSENAVRKLWFRAVEQLQTLLESGASTCQTPQGLRRKMNLRNFWRPVMKGLHREIWKLARRFRLTIVDCNNNWSVFNV